MRWTAVVNPVAGRGRTRRLLPELQNALRVQGATVHVAPDAADGLRAARTAYDRGGGVVACGGDGTVAELAGVAAEHGGPFAVVPTGAGNDFARELGLDLRHPLRAIDLLSTGQLRTVDLGRAAAADGTTRPFTTVANTGFDAEANRWANDITWVRGSALYLLAIARTITTFRPQPLVVRVDDDEWRGRTWLVAVGNTRSYAGGLRITPDAAPDDGLLDVCLITEKPTTTFIARFPSVFRGNHTRVDGVRMLRGRTVEIHGDGGDVELDLWASGERVGPLPATVTIDPSVLRVLVPPTRPDALVSGTGA
jgi:diacylglycerol kinase (ATP)